MRPLIVVLLVLLGAVGCIRPTSEAALTEAEVEDLPDQESWNAALQLSERGDLRVMLSAPYLARYERADSTLVELGPDPLGELPGRVHVQLYGSEAQPTATVVSDRLAYDERTRVFTATGNVLVTTEGSRSLESQQVVWNEMDRRLRAAGSFTFTSPSERIQGVGLVANEDLSRYSFTRARGELEVEE